ncbi:unnamed protein product [Cladocopium goreaui]|uniref:Uncharacterized protein n=1 Tax=Cladocopium goreaui TaxID=2562237 RepID=A0A9P1FSD3_9DINO|nr:unnamed protein product [Cladocopium goreaui]
MLRSNLPQARRPDTWHRTRRRKISSFATPSLSRSQAHRLHPWIDRCSRAPAPASCTTPLPTTVQQVQLQAVPSSPASDASEQRLGNREKPWSPDLVASLVNAAATAVEMATPSLPGFRQVLVEWKPWGWDKLETQQTS